MAREQDRGVPTKLEQQLSPTAQAITAGGEQRELVRFQRRLNLLAAALIIFVVLVHLLDKFSTLLQQKSRRVFWFTCSRRRIVGCSAAVRLRSSLPA